MEITSIADYSGQTTRSTKLISKVSNLPETSSVPETASVPERSSLPKTSSLPGTSSLSFGVKDLARISWETIHGLDEDDRKSLGKLIMIIIIKIHSQYIL